MPGPNHEIEVENVAEAEAAFNELRAQAEGLAAGDVLPFRANASLAYHNVSRGTEAVLARQADLAGKLTTGELEALAAAPKLALAVVFAAGRVSRLSTHPVEGLNDRLARARLLRRVMLRSAEACAEAEVIPAAEVEVIRRGRGLLDTAQDCLALAGLFRRHEGALASKTPVTSQMVVEAAEVGTALVTLIKPANLPPDAAPAAEVAAAAALRDRMWTLLVRRHDDLFKAGAWLWGHAVGDHVPALQSRTRPKK